MLHAVIMAGGSGTRFWPASRADRPKQVLAVAGRDPLVKATVDRLEGLVPADRTLVLTNRRQAPLLREILAPLPPEQVVAEPTPRDTAPCIALAALLVRRRDPEGVMAVLPADQVIGPRERFQAALEAAAGVAAREDALITFGIEPTFPATGYGYIRYGKKHSEAGGISFHRVEAFTEKPDRERARQWFDQGGYHWNSGIFLWRAETILAEIERHAPGLGEVVAQLEAALGTDRWEEALAEHFPRCPRNSIDREIMEKSTLALIAPAPFRWDDLGSWQALPAHHQADEGGNVAITPGGGSHLDLDSRDLVVYAEGKHLVATIGLAGLTIVQTGEATLVCPTERAQEVKEMVELLRRRGREDLL